MSDSNPLQNSLNLLNEIKSQLKNKNRSKKQYQPQSQKNTKSPERDYSTPYQEKSKENIAQVQEKYNFESEDKLSDINRQINIIEYDKQQDQNLHHIKSQTIEKKHFSSQKPKLQPQTQPQPQQLGSQAFSKQIINNIQNEIDSFEQECDNITLKITTLIKKMEFDYPQEQSFRVQQREKSQVQVQDQEVYEQSSLSFKNPTNQLNSSIKQFNDEYNNLVKNMSINKQKGSKTISKEQQQSQTKQSLDRSGVSQKYQQNVHQEEGSDNGSKGLNQYTMNNEQLGDQQYQEFNQSNNDQNDVETNFVQNQVNSQENNLQIQEDYDNNNQKFEDDQQNDIKNYYEPSNNIEEQEE